MPFGHNCEHPNFDSCVATMRGKVDNPEAFCGALMHETEGACKAMEPELALIDVDVIAKAMARTVKTSTAPLLTQMAAYERRFSELEGLNNAALAELSKQAKTITELTERLAIAEARPMQPGPQGEKGDVGPEGRVGATGSPGERGERGEKGEPGERGEKGLQGDVGPAGPVGDRGERGEKGEAGEKGLTGDAGPIGEKGLDGRDGRDGQPGPVGERGEKGADGQPGKDGRDGTLEDATFEQIDDRVAELKRADGSFLGRMVFSHPIYRGLWKHGEEYVRGDSVTFGGSQWIAMGLTTEKPGDGATSWRLAVKRGNDGKPGKDGAKGEPGRDGKDRVYIP